MLTNLLLFLVFYGKLEFVKPHSDAVAGETEINLETDYRAEEILGVELFVNGQSVHYFDKPPFETRVDLSGFKAGPIEFKAIMSLYNGEEIEVVSRSKNYPHFYKEDVNLVRLPVMLYYPQDAKPKPLDLNSFLVHEDGEPQRLDFIMDEREPLELVILLDLSGSMERRLPLARRGLYTLIDLLNDGDRVKIIGFNHFVFELIDFTTDKELLKRKLIAVKADGATNLYGALWAGIHAVSESSMRRAVIVFTDGGQDLNVMVEDLFEKKLEDCISKAKQLGVPVYAMGTGFGIDEEVLTGIAEETGGKFFMLRSKDTVLNAFSTLGGELRHQYLLGYYTNSFQKGWHDIQVSIPNLPLIKLRYPKKLYFK